MRRPPLLPIALLIAGLPLGCLPGPTPTAVTKAPLPLKRPVPSTVPSANTIPLVDSSAAPSTAPQAITLEGTIRLPAGIIGNNGSGLIGKIRFPGIVGNNGANAVGAGPQGNYRTQNAVEQALAVGATVQLVDAAGVAVKGADGQPLTAVTDEEGRFRFTAPLPGQHLVAVVQLPESKGAIQAIVPAGRKQVDADLVSTLTTGYILDQYVKGQANPVGTLAKLPAEVEATTRAKADAALTGGTTAVPDALTTEKVVATVNTLRQKDKALDDQMEVVKKLLIVAGISNLGDGRPASQLYLDVAEILPLADGGAYVRPFGAVFDASSRVWRLRTDNVMEVVIGQGDVFEGSLTGKKAQEVALDALDDIALDAQGRMLLLEEKRLSRLEPDGTLTTLWNGITDGDGLIPMPNDEVLVLTGDKPDTSFKVWSVAPGRSAELRATVPKPESGFVVQAARHSDGQLLVFLETDDEIAYYRLDLAGAKLEMLEGGDAVTAVDDQGRYVAFSGPPKALDPVSKTGPSLGTPAMANPWVDAFGLWPDGRALVFASDQLFRVDQGVWTPLTRSLNEPHQVVPATSFSFSAAMGVAVDADGQTYVSDTGFARLYRIDAAGKIHRAAGGGSISERQANGKPGLDVILDFVGVTRMGPDGRVCFADGSRVSTLDAQGVYRVLYQAPDWDDFVNDFVFGADGTLYVSREPYGAQFSTIVRVPPGSRTETALHTGAEKSYGLALHTDGTLYMMAEKELSSWTAAGGVKPVKQDDRFVDYPAMLFDPQGRLLFGTKRQLVRYDFGSGSFTTIAGPGGRVLDGTGADNSLNNLGSMAFDKGGNLLMTDTDHHQIKRVPKDQL